jgi:hypothetical protein
LGSASSRWVISLAKRSRRSLVPIIDASSGRYRKGNAR